MSRSFNSEIVEDELHTVLLNLTPDDPRCTSLEGWSNLTPEAQAAVQFRYSDPENWKLLCVDSLLGCDVVAMRIGRL